MNASSKPKYRIFISHSSKDDDFGIQLAQDLRHILGDVLAVWYDHTPENGLPGGSDWHILIEDKVRACSTFIVILSPDAVHSKWVMHETQTAIKQKLSGRRKHIIPLMFQPCKGKILMLLDSEYQYVTFPPADPAKTYAVALRELLLALKPVKNMSIAEIQRILQEANVTIVQETVIDPEVQAALDIGEYDVAFERLYRFAQAHQTYRQWNYALHYCEMALKIKPDNIEMQAFKHTIQNYIDSEKHKVKNHRVGRNVYSPYWSRVSTVKQDQEQTPKIRRKRTTGSNKAKPKEELVSYRDTGTISTSSAKKKDLPPMRTGLTIDFMGEASLLLRQSAHFIHDNFSWKELSACGQRVPGAFLFGFFTSDVFLAAVGFKIWLSALSLTEWGILSGIIFLLFTLGIFNTSPALAIVLTVLFWIEWSLLAYHFLKPFLLIICLAGIVFAYLRFLLLFCEHKRRARRRRR